jgi:hypothetical protein
MERLRHREMAQIYRIEQPLPEISYKLTNLESLSIDGSCINSLTEEDLRE